MNSWFDEQIRQRMNSDQEVFEDSLLMMASAVVGKKELRLLTDDRVATKAAIDEVLKYYGEKPVEIPDDVEGLEDQMEIALRRSGTMYREVKLSENWYKDAYGPMLAVRKEDHRPVVLLPGRFSGYVVKDADGNKEKAGNHTADMLEGPVYCFYRSLPQRAIGIPDLIRYMQRCLTADDYLFIIGLTLLVTMTGLMTTHLTHMLTGFVLESGKTARHWSTALFFAGVLLSEQLISSSRSLMMTRLEKKTSLSVESAVMSRLISLPAPFFKKYSSGELSSRSNSVNALCTLVVGTLFSTGLTSLTSLLYITQIFNYAPGLTVPAITVIIVTTLITLLSSLWQMRISKQMMEYSAKESGVSYALLNGIQKVKLAGAEKRAFARWAEAYSKAASLTYDPPFFLKIQSTITTAVSLAGTIAMYYFAVKTKVTPSEYMAFSVAYGMVTGAFLSLAGIAISVAQIKPILSMAEPILKAEPETSEGKELVSSVHGAIEFSNVYFRYDDKMPWVLNGIDLKIKAGEYIAIVGRTGCGKSTLVRLLLGFEKPEKGAVYYDGRDIETLDPRSLRRQIGTVTQDGSLFQGDIYSNIMIAAPHLGLNEAWEAAEIAGIADDIRRMPMGMHTYISEGNGGISGGQKQRIMIARAVAPKPKILIFDEATSALDNITQKKVAEALDRLKCTRIVIAHRLSTIRNCDRILMMDGGVITEQGTYDELIEKKGMFAELVERQRLG